MSSLRCASAGRWSRSLVVAALALLATATAARAQKTDTIVINNGDRLTAEIKSLERGSLTVKTDALSTVTVYWSDVVSLTSTKNFEIEIASGQRYYGSLAPGGPRMVAITGLLGSKATLSMLDIVRISPLNQTFWHRLDGSIDVGFSFTQASQQTQWTLNTNVSYRQARYLSEAKLSSQLTAIEGADTVTRNALTLSSQRYLGSRNYLIGFGQFQQDESLGVNFRSTLGAAYGRYLVQRRQTTLSTFGGIAFTREQFTGEDYENSAEALFGADVEWFTPGESDTDFSTTAVSYYNISGTARVRLEVNTAFKRKFLKDLNWSINAFNSFDSTPSEGQKQNDFGVSLSLGWTF